MLGINRDLRYYFLVTSDTLNPPFSFLFKYLVVLSNAI